jgi:hypothetical protein
LTWIVPRVDTAYPQAEGWHIMDGFYYITSMLCSLPNPLTDVSPETDEGKIVDIIIAIWQGGYSEQALDRR